MKTIIKCKLFFARMLLQPGKLVVMHSHSDVKTISTVIHLDHVVRLSLEEFLAVSRLFPSRMQTQQVIGPGAGPMSSQVLLTGLIYGRINPSL